MSVTNWRATRHPTVELASLSLLKLQAAVILIPHSMGFCAGGFPLAGLFEYLLA